jgi:hypothetical protein
MSLIRKGGDQTAANSSLNIVHRKVVHRIRPGEMQSAIVIIAASLPTDLEFDPAHTYFVVDPFARGDVREIVRKKRTGTNVIYIPAPSEDGLVPALLSVIKMTEREPFADSRVLVNGVQSLLEPAPLASQTIAWLAAFDVSVTDVVLQAEFLTLEIPVVEALKYSTVSKWRLRFQDGSDDLFDLARSGRPSRSDVAAPIQSLLQQFPFISCQVLCNKLKIGKTACLRVLHDDLHSEEFNLWYVRHSLEAGQKRSRVEFSRELLQILKQDQQYEFEHILTGDERWFFLNVFIVHVGPQIQRASLKFRSKKFNLKVPHCDYLG